MGPQPPEGPAQPTATVIETTYRLASDSIAENRNDPRGTTEMLEALGTYRVTPPNAEIT